MRTRLGTYCQIKPFALGEGLYTTVYPSSCPNTDTVLFQFLLCHLPGKSSQMSLKVALQKN